MGFLVNYPRLLILFYTNVYCDILFIVLFLLCVKVTSFGFVDGKCQALKLVFEQVNIFIVNCVNTADVALAQHSTKNALSVAHHNIIKSN